MGRTTCDGKRSNRDLHKCSKRTASDGKLGEGLGMRLTRYAYTAHSSLRPVNYLNRHSHRLVKDYQMKLRLQLYSNKSGRKVTDVNLHF